MASRDAEAFAFLYAWECSFFSVDLGLSFALISAAVSVCENVAAPTTAAMKAILRMGRIDTPLSFVNLRLWRVDELILYPSGRAWKQFLVGCYH